MGNAKMGSFFKPLSPGKWKQISAFNPTRLKEAHDLHCEFEFAIVV